MTHALVATNFTWAALAAFFVRHWFKHQTELGERLDAREVSHREEVAALNQARMEETANLLQRIQAPEQAVVSHAVDSAPPDAPPTNLENDQEMFELYEARLQNMGALSG